MTTITVTNEKMRRVYQLIDNLFVRKSRYGNEKQADCGFSFTDRNEKITSIFREYYDSPAFTKRASDFLDGVIMDLVERGAAEE